MTPPRWQRHGARSIRSETWLTPRIASFCPARYPVCTGQTSTPRGSRQRPRRWQCGALAERRTGIELTVIAFDVTLKMPTSRQGTAAFYPPLRLALPWEERDPACEVALAAGFSFLAGGTSSPRSELLWCGRRESFRGMSQVPLQPRLRPESGAFSFCVAAVSDSWSARRTRQRSRQWRGGPIPVASS